MDSQSPATAPSEKSGIIGLIAGGGQFPLMAAEAARKQGLTVVAVALYGETDETLSQRVDDIVWIKLGQLGHLIKAFKKRGVTKALMAGTINKKRVFGNVRPDLKLVSLISKMIAFHDDDILGAIAGEMAKEGVEIVSSTIHLPELLAPKKCLTKKKPTKSEEEDIHLGWEVAKELGRRDIGQCVVVRDKTVLALEAIDGSDATILRGGKLAQEKAVVVKVSKPNQDLRFDVPTVGLDTLKIMSSVKASVLAVEAGKTLMFDKEEMIAFADKSHMCIVCK